MMPPGEHPVIALSQQLRPSLGTRRGKAGCAIERLKICAHHAVMLRRFLVTPETLFIQLPQQQSLCFRQGGQHGGCQFSLQEEQGAAPRKVMSLFARQLRPGWIFQKAVIQEPYRSRIRCGSRLCQACGLPLQVIGPPVEVLDETHA
ncbi:MAG: hypothetical protein B7Y21_13740 [Hydrogenophilales bacterium 16-61-112]|nr:MAG: hypothetical protein B7Y21_13740 [Hydrogenophilales bacterium 16-61-112]